jgi:hypothetical protein
LGPLPLALFPCPFLLLMTLLLADS